MEKITAFDMKTSLAESVINLFDTMLSMKVELYETDSETGLDGFRMTGSLSLAGDVMGTMAIQVSDVFARLMTAAMMGIESEEIESEEEVKDVIREVCNIVGGSLKSALDDLGLSSEISIPSITTGKDFVIETLNMERYEFFTFRYQDHKFFVEVCIKAAANIDSEAQRQLTGIDIHKFKRLDIISTSGDSVIEFFKTMLDLDLELSEKVSKSDSDDLQIMGLINFAGSVTGSLNIQTS
jgi:CheY-specific phosphatase CheX